LTSNIENSDCIVTKVKSHALLLFIVWAVLFMFCYEFYGIVIFD